MGIPEIRSHIEAIEKNAVLHEERNFEVRTEAIDFIGFQLMGLIEDLHETDEVALLKEHAEKLMSELEAIDSRLFERLRAGIRAGECRGAAFKAMLEEYIDFNAGDEDRHEEPGYDSLDIFINGLFPQQALPEQSREPEPEMVYYQKTPARIVFELAEGAHFRENDVFFDLGSGLGQVVILVHLLSGIKARGIEFEPSFCDYAQGCAAGLHLAELTFINVDARDADYSEGNVFFMFTPFRGAMLQEVLEMLRKESQKRKIRIISYGPCTAELALQSWLNRTEPEDKGVYKLAVFSSL